MDKQPAPNRKEDIDLKETLKDPSIPIDFLEHIFIENGGQCLWAWIMDNTPQEVQDLYTAIEAAQILVREAAEHGGKVVAGPLDWDTASFSKDILKGIRAMNTLGFKW